MLVMTRVVSAKSLQTGSILGDIRPVETLFQPIVVESHGVGQIVGANRSHATV